MLTRDPNLPESTEGVYFCQIDSYQATKDYLRNGRCIRLFGVESVEFSNQAFEDGVTTFVIDIDYWEFCIRTLGLKHAGLLTKRACESIDNRAENLEHRNIWYRVQVEFCERASGYVYRAFSEEKERYFKLKSIESLPTTPESSNFCALPKESLNPLPTFLTSIVPSKPTSVLSNNHFVFETFHVGQGMCSLVHNGHMGILLDVGAGKPVTRQAYLAGTINNELQTTVKNLESLDLVISHLDSDHWRILGWDSSLRDKVRSGERSLPLKDKEIKAKIKPLGNQAWKLCSQTYLHLLRSKPSSQDSNGNCLVAIFERNGERVLAAGDYVYERFASDKNAGISDLHNHKYAAVVVPHHGDAASANNIVPAAQRALAFFSAGTHQGYGHPTDQSLTAHTKAKYRQIEDHTKSDIVRVPLL